MGKDTFYLAYADGKPHHSFGTTCYGWVHQGDSLAKLTLKTLTKGYFNKIRMCIFPKDYDRNKNEPPLYPAFGRSGITLQRMKRNSEKSNKYIL